MHPPSPKHDRLKKILLTLAMIMAVMTSLGLILYRWQNDVDVQNHAVRVMFAVMNDYLQAHEGTWPKNWEQLEEFPSSGNWYDPINFEMVKKHVVIDFDPDFRKIAHQTPREFQAIRPINPVFDFGKDPRLIRLLKTIHRYHGDKKTSASP